MDKIMEQYRKQFLIDNDLMELVEVPEERQKKLMEEYEDAPAFGSEDFLNENNVTYDRHKKKFYTKVPLDLTDEEIEKFIAMKGLYLKEKDTRNLNTIKNIAIFFCVIAVIFFVIPILFDYLMYL